jgi:hypothetical protein
MLIWPYGSMHVAMVRRVCIDRVGDFDEHLIFAEDWDLWLRVARHYGVANLDQSLATYRQSAGSVSRGALRREGPAMFRRVLDKLFADPERWWGWTPHAIEHARRRAYASLEITIALMVQEPPWRHILAAGRLCPSVLRLRWRAVGFLILQGLLGRPRTGGRRVH